MSILFDDGTPDWLENSNPPVTVAPISMAAWFKTDNADAGQCIIQIADKDVISDFWGLLARGDVAGDPVAAVTRDGGGFIAAESTSGYSVNTWHHGVAVFAASDDRRAYIDGGNEGTENTDLSPDNADLITIGMFRDSSVSGAFSGYIAEAAVWNVALSAAEIAILALGYSPLFVRPQNLVFYVPMVRNNHNDLVGGLSMSENGTPSIAAHPRIIYPITPFMSYPTAAAGGRTTKNTRSFPLGVRHAMPFRM